MVETDVAWLAGLLEGEGCFGVSIDRRPARRNSRPRVLVALKMTDEDVVRRASALMMSPSVEHCTDPRPRCSDTYQTRVSGARAEYVMRLVRPYMGARRGARIDEILATPNLSHHERNPA